MRFYEELRDKFKEILKDNSIDIDNETIIVKNIAIEEGIGKPDRDDYPILEGKEALVNGYFRNSVGQAYTDQNIYFKGNIKDVLELDLNEVYNLPIFIATMNSVLRELNYILNTIHCKDEEPKSCSKKILDKMKKLNPKKILLVGLQPGILSKISREFEVRVLDLNPKNIGTFKEGVFIEDGKTKLKEGIEFADLILVTGSTVCNGSIIDFLDLDKEVYFYGTSIAGTSFIMDLKRLCFCSK